MNDDNSWLAPPLVIIITLLTISSCTNRKEHSEIREFITQIETRLTTIEGNHK